MVKVAAYNNMSNVVSFPMLYFKWKKKKVDDYELCVVPRQAHDPFLHPYFDYYFIFRSTLPHLTSK